MKRIASCRPISQIALVLMLALILPPVAGAIPSAEFTYQDPQLDSGAWRYDFTLFNTSDPTTDIGADLYDLFFTYDTDSGLAMVDYLLPSGWLWIAGGPGYAFLTTTSGSPGLPPDGSDIAPGASLSGFAFWFNDQLPTLYFDVSFVNPNPDQVDPIVLTGLQSQPAPAPVPEPSTMVLLSAGLAAGGLLRARRNKKASSPQT
jgi:hypothetical protein